MSGKEWNQIMVGHDRAPPVINSMKRFMQLINRTMLLISQITSFCPTPVSCHVWFCSFPTIIGHFLSVGSSGSMLACQGCVPPVAGRTDCTDQVFVGIVVV